MTDLTLRMNWGASSCIVMDIRKARNLEKFVRLAGAAHPPLVLVCVEVPDDAALFIQSLLADLPQDWPDLRAAASAQEFGRRWLASAQELVMLVPSVMILESPNAVINPAHPAYRHVPVEIVQGFSFDARMFK